MTIEELEKAFIASSEKWLELTESDNSDDQRFVNKEFDYFHSHIKPSVRALPDRGESLLKGLVSHENEAVRSNAASLLIAIDEDLALKTLKNLEKSAKNLSISMNAQMLPEEWKAGNLSEFLG